MSRLPIAALVLPMAMLPGCGVVTVACTTLFAYGISIEVDDATTGLGVTEGMSGTLTDGEYHEVMEGGFGNTLLGAGEREGTYTAVVTAPGYLPWQQDGIQVRSDECHVIGVPISVDLIPTP